ncbi:MAG: methylmalonyl Co-A mutase-associated GTPase MeaB [Myxococcales bacterium]|nr:methylmalonyl Co-A mutase-associated GTPase MeaB [Myxococcales bacterium]USN50500.1 MAG: methylmalonyl Co-A mutase-associated GTPase MeaB [Myxococcales bacterium]
MKDEQLLKSFLSGDRRALSQLITLIESDRESDRKKAAHLLKNMHNSQKSLRIALSGPPGVGKSSLINVLGKKLRAQNYKVAILPIDPASEVHGGSILADKTRMTQLLDDEGVYIRPSSSRAVLGGVSVATHDVIFAVESFGFNAVIIETVGVGQSETLAYSLADHFVVMMQPGAGDQLQALKKGILERADFIIVNKFDDALKSLARATYNQLKGALNTPVYLVSAMLDIGVDDFCSDLFKTHQQKMASAYLFSERQKRLHSFLRFAFEREFMKRLFEQSSTQEKAQRIIQEIVTKKQALAPELNAWIDEIFNRIQ